MAGRGFGKTRIGAEEIRAAAKRVKFPNLIGATADDARDIMIEGESGILAICPPWERPTYHPAKRQLSWPSGAKSLVFTADEPERLRGKQHEWLWADEVAAWRYPEAWDQAMLGLRLGTNPQAVVTTTPKPNRLIRELIANTYTVVTRGSTYDNVANLAPAFAEEIIRKYEGTRLGRQELLGELLEDEGLAYRFDERAHCVPDFVIPNEWLRSEGMDFGSTAPTAWLACATDYEGNALVFDEFYEPGLPSDTAPKIALRRKGVGCFQPWEPQADGWRVGPANRTFGDPSIRNLAPIAGRMGLQTSVLAEFADQGLPIVPANNDRRAGYIRIAELLRCDAERRFPAWHPQAGKKGAPLLYFMAGRCKNLVAQLKDAPLEDEKGRFPGEAVDGDWEGSHGHAHAALRYWALTRPPPSVAPVVLPDDPRELAWFESERRLEDPNYEVDDDPFVTTL